MVRYTKYKLLIISYKFYSLNHKIYKFNSKNNNRWDNPKHIHYLINLNLIYNYCINLDQINNHYKDYYKSGTNYLPNNSRYYIANMIVKICKLNSLLSRPSKSILIRSIQFSIGLNIVHFVISTSLGIKYIHCYHSFGSH